MIVYHMCQRCKREYEENISINTFGINEEMFKYTDLCVLHDYCEVCCDPVEPAIEDIEHFISLKFLIYGAGLSKQEKKWLFEVTPLPFIDSDEEAIGLAIALCEMKGWWFYD